MVPVLDAFHAYVGAWALGWKRVLEIDTVSVDVKQHFSNSIQTEGSTDLHTVPRSMEGMDTGQGNCHD